MIDAQGRLWGRINIIDFGALLLLLLVIGGFLGLRGVRSTTAQRTQATTLLEFDVLVRGLSVGDPNSLFKVGDKPRIIIRNQPAGQLTIRKLKIIPNVFPVVRANGSLEYVPNMASPYSKDILITLMADAQMTDDGAVVGGTKLKVATLIELETARYDIKGSVIDLREVAKK